LAAAAGNNIGKGLQKAATRGLPALTLARKEVSSCFLFLGGGRFPPTLTQFVFGSRSWLAVAQLRCQITALSYCCCCCW
jgi:hypothetical protein